MKITIKNTAFLILFFSVLFLTSVKTYCAEVFDTPEENTVEQAVPEQSAEDEAEKKKFFSILEKNPGAKNDKPKKEAKSKKNSKEDEQSIEEPVTNVQVDSDELQYYPERHEFEAIGHAKVYFPSQNSTLSADKILFNHDTNYIKAYDNVVILRENEKILGDYVQINLNDENALITEPVMSHMNIQIKAKSGNINQAKVEAMEGTAKFTDSQIFHLNVRSIYNFDSPMLDTEADRQYLLKEKYNNEWNLKSKIIIIDSYKDRDIVTLQNSDIFLQNLKIGSTGKIKIYTDKEQQYVETNIMEFGSIRNLGAFIAPSYVFELPFSSTFKVGPMVNYDNSNFGFGGLGRFQNAHNRTDIGYSTARSRIILRGHHDFNENWRAEYGINSYMNEWWMGGRMPAYGGQLVFAPDTVKSEDLRLTFNQRYSAGFFKDWHDNTDRNFSTMRFRWQTTTNKGIYRYENSDKKLAMDFGLSLQTNATLYGTGDTYGLIRFGPTIRTRYRGWQQFAAYYVGGSAGDSPFWFDKYFYGKSSVQLGEALRINKYLSVMYSTMLALSDTPNDKFIQENRFYVVIGPDDFRVLIGYDAYRKNTSFGINMAVGTENSEVAFKKLILNEPENIGKSNKKNKKKISDKEKEKKELDPMNRSVKDYDDVNRGYGALNNFIMPGIRPQGY